MFCKNCGKEIRDEAKFCPSCGTGVAHANQSETEMAPSTVPQVKKVGVTGGALDQVVRFGSIIFGIIIGRYLGVALFVFLFAFLVGQWLPKWYLKRDHANVFLVKFIVWSNVLTWFLPPLGILTGFAALEFSNYFPNERKKFKTLAIIGILLSLFNTLIGILTKV